MGNPPWLEPSSMPPGGLGVVAHGPAVLARSPGIAFGLRCVFAYPEGLLMPAVARAAGIQAEAAHRWISPVRAPSGRTVPRLAVEVGDRVGPLHAVRAESSSSEDAFDFDAWYWLGAVPPDGRLRLTAGWAEAGLREATTVLELAGLDRLGDVLPLL